MLKYLLALAVAGSLAFAGGCEKKSDSGGASSGGASGDGSARPRLVYIPKNAGNPYFYPLTEGFKQAVEEAGGEFSTVASDAADATSQLPLIKDQIQRGVAVITISPNSPDALNAVFAEARSKGISIVTVDSDLTGNEQHRDIGVLPVESNTVGESQIELLGSLIGYEGEFAILSATPDAPNQNRWIEVMKGTLQSNPKYAKMKLVELVYGNDEPQKSLTEAEALLTKHPNLKGIIAPTTVGIAAAAQAVETAKKADKVSVTGLGTPNQMRRFIKNGTVKAFALWSPKDEGYLAGHVAAALAKKSLTVTPGSKVVAGTLGEKTIQDKGVIITGPPVVFTKDNIDQFNF